MADYGWAYVKHDLVSGAGGDLGSVVFRGTDETDLTGSSQLVYDYANTTLILSGTLFVSGAINANELNLDVTNKSVTNITSTGSTKFGDTSDDLHQVTGSIHVAGNLSSSAEISASAFYGDGSNLTGLAAPAIGTYTNTGNNRVITSVDSDSVNAEANLTFDGTKLSIVGNLTSSTWISGSSGHFAQLSSSQLLADRITDGTIVLAGGNVSDVNQFSAEGITGSIHTAAQTKITSVGNLVNLTVDSTTLAVNSTSNKVGIGRTAPDKKLEVVDNSAAQLRLSHTADTKFADFHTTTDGYLILSASEARIGIHTAEPTAMLAVSGTTHLSGNVGIGTTAPNYKLDVLGDARVTGNLYVSGTLSARVTDFEVSANTLTFGDSLTDSLVLNAATASIPNGINFDSNAFVIDAGNNRIGIGVQYPDTTLQVLSTTDQLKLSYDGSNATSFSVNSLGNINITPSGGDLTASADVLITGHVNLGNASSDIVTIPGQLTSSIGITSSVGQFTQLSGSSFTDGTIKIEAGMVSGIVQLTASSIQGTLTTSDQPNITELGDLVDLTVDGTTLVVNGSTNKVAIGRSAPDKKLEIVDNSDHQLRLSHTAGSKYADIKATTDGYLILTPSHTNVGIGTATPTAHLAVSGNLHVSASSNPVKIQGLSSAQTTTGSFLALDSNNNLILTSSGTVVTEYVSASILTYTNPADNRILTSVNATSVNGEANLTFDGTVLSVSGQLSSSVGISSSVGQYGTLTSEVITDGVLTANTGAISGITSLNASAVSSSTMTSNVMTADRLVANTSIAGTLLTANQPNITDVGNLVDLTVDSTTLVVKSTTSRVGIGRSGPQKKLEVLDNSAAQLRLTHTADDKYADFHVTSDGYLTLSASYSRIGIGTTDPIAEISLSGSTSISSSANPLSLLGLQSGSIAGPGSYLGINGSGQVVLTASSGGGSVSIANDADNRIVTAVGDGTINGEINLTFDNNFLNVQAGLAFKRRTITSTVTASIRDYYIGVSASTSVAIQLLDASALNNGATYVIKDERGNVSSDLRVVIRASGSQTIDGESEILLESPYSALNLYSDGVSKYFIY